MRYFIFFLLTAHFTLSAQPVKFKCIVLNQHTSEPIPYATLGLKERPIGTNADEQGIISFHFNPGEIQSSETWILSSVGYQAKHLTHGELITLHRDTIYLQEAPQLLEEVRLTRAQLKSRTAGKSAHGALTHFTIYSVRDSIDDGLSQEFGVKLSLRKPCLVEKFNIFFSSNNFEVLLMQFMLYQGDSLQLLPTPAVTFEVVGHGWTSVDLSHLNLELTPGRYAFTARIIKKEFSADRPYLAIPVTMPSPFNGFLYRQKSEDTWNFNNAANPSIYLNLLCE